MFIGNGNENLYAVDASDVGGATGKGSRFPARDAGPPRPHDLTRSRDRRRPGVARGDAVRPHAGVRSGPGAQFRRRGERVGGQSDDGVRPQGRGHDRRDRRRWTDGRWSGEVLSRLRGGRSGRGDVLPRARVRSRPLSGVCGDAVCVTPVLSHLWFAGQWRDVVASLATLIRNNGQVGSR
jgi:hypothetical protein